MKIIMINMMVNLNLIIYLSTILILILPILNNNIHPVNYMLNFMVFIFLMMMNLYLNLNKPLYPMIILISIMGGVMVIFNYFLSLINNEKSKMTLFNFWLFMILLTFLILLNLIISLKNIYYLMNYFNSSYLLNYHINFFKIYFYPMSSLTLMMMFLLMICLILCFKMCTYKFKPLRKLTN